MMLDSKVSYMNIQMLNIMQFAFNYKSMSDNRVEKNKISVEYYLLKNKHQMLKILIKNY